MRILYSSFTFFPDVNGQAVFTLNLIQEMVALGHDCLILTQEAGIGQADLSDPEIKIIRFHSLSLNRIFKDLKIPIFSQTAIQKIFREFQPDLVHVQDPSPLSQAVIHEAHRCKVPVLINHHTGPEITAPYINTDNLHIKRFLHRIFWYVLRLHLNQANLIIVPSTFSKQMLKHHGVRSDVSVVACGIKLENFKPFLIENRSIIRQNFGLDKEKILLLFVGRLDFEKNIDSLIHAIALMNNPSFQLAIVGQGAKEKYLRNLTKGLGLEHQIIFVGEVSNVELPRILNSADIFVMPGNGESFSIATLEAMACAKPIVAAKASALPELVDHQKNGLLFQPNCQKDLADSLLKLVDNVELRELMGASGYDKAQNYSLSHMSHGYEQAYQSYYQSFSKLTNKRMGERLSVHTLFLYLSKQRIIISKQLLIFLIAILIFLSTIFIFDQAQAKPENPISDITSFTISIPERLMVIASHLDDEFSMDSNPSLPQFKPDESGWLYRNSVDCT